MAKQEITTRLIRSSEVNVPFTRHLQSIALEAWTTAFNGEHGGRKREPEEIAQAFNPDNPRILAEAQAQYRAFAFHGHLIVAAANEYGPIVGFSMARNDVSPKGSGARALAGRSYKRALAVAHNQFMLPVQSRVYAWEKHIAVQPDAPRGAGTLLVAETLRGFYYDQTSTAYIDDENQQSQDFFRGLGYECDGGEPKPVYRFGVDNEPSAQRRFAAPVFVALSRCAIQLAEIAGEA